MTDNRSDGEVDLALLDPARCPFHHVITTRCADVDPNRHVNNVALAAAFEDARYRSAVSPRFHQTMGGNRVMIAANHIDYVGEARYPDDLDLHVGSSRSDGRAGSLPASPRRAAVDVPLRAPPSLPPAMAAQCRCPTRFGRPSMPPDST